MQGGRAEVTLRNVLFLHRESAGSLPLMDLYETDDDLVLEIDLPGINRDDILIKVCEDVMIIEGIKREIQEEKKFRYICMERSFESFRRMIRIPVPVNPAAGRAEYSGGVITVTLPKIKERVIKIKIVDKED
jgi:HSP20 family protein